MQQFPRFQQTHLSNFTVRVGKSIQFSCTVENLGPLYKVDYLLLYPVYKYERSVPVVRPVSQFCKPDLFYACS